MFLSRRPTLFPLIQKLRGKTTGTYCTKSTDLCIEGFESSANTFVYNAFRTLDEELGISHHTHTVANLKRAQRYNVPTLILYRDPSDAIPSLISRFRPEAEEARLRYLHFYRHVLDNADEFLLVSFEEATNDIRAVVRRVNDRWGFGFSVPDSDDFEQRVKNGIKEWAEKHGDEERISLPREEREQRKEQIRDHLRTQSALDEAKNIYAQLQDARR
jgi:hypothetical protein